MSSRSSSAPPYWPTFFSSGKLPGGYRVECFKIYPKEILPAKRPLMMYRDLTRRPLIEILYLDVFNRDFVGRCFSESLYRGSL